MNSDFFRTFASGFKVYGEGGAVPLGSTPPHTANPKRVPQNPGCISVVVGLTIEYRDVRSFNRLFRFITEVETLFCCCQVYHRTTISCVGIFVPEHIAKERLPAQWGNRRYSFHDGLFFVSASGGRGLALSAGRSAFRGRPSAPPIVGRAKVWALKTYPWTI